MSLLNKNKKNTKTPVASTILGDDLDFILHEEYRLLRTNIRFSLSNEKNCHCIGVTSAIAGEAKTTTSINLAYTLAENGEKVCLIEGDMRLPTIGKKLLIPNHTGLSEFLTGQATPNDVVEKITFKQCQIHCIQAGTIPPNPAELLSSKRFEKLLEALSDSFTYIIIDLPPVTVVTDAIIVGEKLDGVIMVISQAVCTKRLLNEAIRSISLAKIRLLGFVRTRSTDRGFGYGKYKKKGYKYRSDYSYGNPSNNKDDAKK